jgi:hypothetical protein
MWYIIDYSRKKSYDADTTSCFISVIFLLFFVSNSVYQQPTVDLVSLQNVEKFHGESGSLDIPISILSWIEGMTAQTNRDILFTSDLNEQQMCEFVVS